MMRQRCVRSPLAAFLVLVFGLAAIPAAAAVYSWVDEHGVVHMTDRKVEDSTGKVKQIGPVESAPGQGSRRFPILKMIGAARSNPRFAELQAIAAEYHRNHSYSMADYFVCVDMALEMYNILKTKRFAPSVVAGNAKVDTSGMDPEKMMGNFDHAWVVVELEPGVRVAVETTGGFLVDDKVSGFENYYQGLVFANPRQAKETDELIHGVKDDCMKAQQLVEAWTNQFVGRPKTEAAIEAKGRVDAKVSDCLSAKNKYKELIKAQYRKLY